MDTHLRGQVVFPSHPDIECLNAQCIEHYGDNDQLTIIEAKLNYVMERIDKAETTISRVADEVMPTLNELLDSPMLKMLMPKGKKK